MLTPTTMRRPRIDAPSGIPPVLVIAEERAPRANVFPSVVGQNSITPLLRSLSIPTCRITALHI